MINRDFFVIYEERKIAGHGIKRSMFGFTSEKDIAIAHLMRLYHIDPFQTNAKYSLEMCQYKPTTGYEIKER